MKSKIDVIVSIVMIALIVVGYILTVFASPLAPFFMMPGIVGGLAWIFLVRPNLFKK